MGASEPTAAHATPFESRRQTPLEDETRALIKESRERRLALQIANQEFLAELTLMEVKTSERIFSSRELLRRLSPKT